MTAKTCPAPGVFAPNGVLDPTGLPGGCTRDLVHRYYQEQYQLDGGKQDRYVTGSDAVGLTMGYYDTSSLPVYKYLHTRRHPAYAIADDFFQARLRRLVPQPPVAGGGGDADLAQRGQRRRPQRPALRGRRQRHADHQQPNSNTGQQPAPLYNSPLATGSRTAR